MSDLLQENDEALDKALDELDFDEIDRLLTEREKILIQNLKQHLSSVRQSVLGLRKMVGMIK